MVFFFLRSRSRIDESMSKRGCVLLHAMITAQRLISEQKTTVAVPGSHLVTDPRGHANTEGDWNAQLRNAGKPINVQRKMHICKAPEIRLDITVCLNRRNLPAQTINTTDDQESYLLRSC